MYSRADANPPLSTAVFESVRNEILETLRQGRKVSSNSRQIRGNGTLQCELSCLDKI
jgi:hypothetical protein